MLVVDVDVGARFEVDLRRRLLVRARVSDLGLDDGVLLGDGARQLVSLVELGHAEGSGSVEFLG